MDRKIIAIVAITVITIISSLMAYIEQNNHTFTIEKQIDGYDIYKNGELKHEFTTRNTDSLSLETLKMIYED